MLQLSWKKLRATLKSRPFISSMKGALAYLLVFVLIFIKGFQDLQDFPITYTSAIIVAVAAFPGGSVGACLFGCFLAQLGVALGALNFFILAKLGHAPVAQGFVFFVLVYILALVKAQGMQFFGFALLCILMSFNGIYTSLLLNGEFSSVYLLDYFKAYLWGAAIVIFVNVCIFPRSSEKDLRAALVTSIDHIRTFSHLIGKTYRQDITSEEIKTRDMLNATIRSDFSILEMKLKETFIEINWSRFSMADYSRMVSQTRAMQQALITTYSSLMGVETDDLDLFREVFLSNAREEFNGLQKALFTTLTDIQRDLAVGKWSPGPYKPHDLERQNSNPLSNTSTRDVDDDEQAGIRLKTVQEQLAAELANASAHTPMPSRKQSLDGTAVESQPDRTSGTAGLAADGSSITDKTPCVISLRKRWESFRGLQFERIGGILASGSLHGGGDTLIVEQPLPSIRNMWGNDHIRGQQAKGHRPPFGLRDLRSPRNSVQEPRLSRPPSNSNIDENKKTQEPTDSLGEDAEEEEEVVNTHHSLIRVYSFSYGMTQFVDAAIELHHFILKASERKKRMHVHVFEGVKLGKQQKMADKEERKMSMKEAMATLEGREYVPTKVTIWERLAGLELAARSPNSICAFKTACATSIFTAFFLAPSVRAFAINYGITGGLLTITVAITPTLGQSLVSFILQISGQGIGYLFAFITLEIFHNVGGYKYNPYGLACFLAVYGIPLSWIMYTKPQFFVLALLGMNSAGVLIVTEWTYRERASFDSPALRMGKGFATLAIALALVGAFQLLILRNPARRTLRKAVANIMKANTAYTLILQAFVRATVPADPSHRPPAAAIARVEAELRNRELQIQGDLIALRPLLMFAGAEPSLVKPFDQKTYLRLIQACQIVLDRNRDARIALGSTPLDDRILTNFVTVLSPYRRRTTRFVRAVFYMCTTSLSAKFPLPSELPLASDFLPAFFNDCLVLCTRIAQTPDGLDLLKSAEFQRYWMYLLSATSIGYQLQEVEECLKILFGNLEDDHALYALKED